MPRKTIKQKIKPKVESKPTLRKRNIKTKDVTNSEKTNQKSNQVFVKKQINKSFVNSLSKSTNFDKKKRHKPEDDSELNSSPTKRQRKQTFPKETYSYEPLINVKSDDQLINDNINNTNNNNRSFTNTSENFGNEDLFECDFCDQTFGNKLKRYEHLRSSHKNERKAPFPELVESKSASEGRFKCGKCNFKTDSEAEMLLHSLNHTVKQELESDSGEEYYCNQHEKEVEKILPNDSNDFFDEMQTNSKEKRVKKRKDNKKYSCPCCERMFPKYQLKKHIYIHTSEKPFRCDVCNKEFANVHYLKSHEKKHNELKEDFCEICNASFASKKSLSKHQIIHQTDRPKTHLCEICGIAFYDKESLKAHTFRMHLPKDARKFKCQFAGCRYSCLYQHQLLEHQKVHSDDKPWACDQCDYTAKSKWTFKKHYRKHTKERPFKCPHCDYASGLSSNLTRHLRIHTGSKPFKCPYCSYSCNNHENLRKHVLNTKKHEGLLLYNCTHCSFGTNVFTELRKHIEQTHSDIYTVEEIDRMISSIYHKHEDNTTVVPTRVSNSDDSNEFQQNLIQKSRKTYSVKKKAKNGSNQEMLQMIIINPIVQQSDNCEEVVLPDSIEDKPTIYFAETDSMDKSKNCLSNNTPTQGSSEVIIIDSDVLEAEEICVSEQTGGKNNSQIVIAISK